MEKFYSSKTLLKIAGGGMHTQHTFQMPRRNAALKLLQGCHLLVLIAKISKNHHNIGLQK